MKAYDIEKFENLREKLLVSAEKAIENEDAILRVAAQLMHNKGMSYGAIEAMDALSPQLKYITELEKESLNLNNQSANENIDRSDK